MLQLDLLTELAEKYDTDLGNIKIAPDDWETWLRFFYPNHVSVFGDHHVKIWEWFYSLNLSEKSIPLVAILARGGGKSTTAELATAFVGATARKKYVLYVRSTQDQADRSVDNIASLLENPLFEEYYPLVASPAVNKFGRARGWRRNRLWTESGFTVDAFGLDSAMRGTKVEEVRPDLIILDDIDEKHDTPGTSQKKIEKITQTIFPAGGPNYTVFAIQNKIISHGFFSQLCDNTADYLRRRTLIGPIPAVEDLEYELTDDTETGGTKYIITGGTATWEVQNLEKCEAQINDWGIIGFLSEAQHQTDVVEGGTYDGVNFQRIGWDKLPPLSKIVCWVDPAVSDTDESDSMGIQIDGISGEKDDRKIYRLYSFELRSSPRKIVRLAIEKSLELGATEIGFETDQGGDLWRDEYDNIWEQMKREGALEIIAQRKLWRNPTDDSEPRKPTFKFAKAGSVGGKRHRHNEMRSAYDRGEFIHVLGTHQKLENALLRFPVQKPFDLADAAYWSWKSLRKGKGWVRGASS